jgi:predicted nucleotidyltransferase component of viral defense system
MNAGATSAFPVSFQRLEEWARTCGASLQEARRRFAQYAVCLSVADSGLLRGVLVLKGGNALYFAYGALRSTLDMDFSAGLMEPAMDLEKSRAALDLALSRVAARLGIRLKVQTSERNPPDLLVATPTYRFKIAYALPGDRWYKRWGIVKRAVPTVVEMEIAVNEEICEAGRPFAEAGMEAVAVCSIEDIFAEKLRALLQQVQRNRSRPQDVYDLAAILLKGPAPNTNKVSEYLKRKCAARNLIPSLVAFEDDRVWTRASENYAALKETVHGELIEFSSAKARIIEFLKRLDLPARGPLVQARNTAK